MRVEVEVDVGRHGRAPILIAFSNTSGLRLSLPVT